MAHASTSRLVLVTRALLVGWGCSRPPVDNRFVPLGEGRTWRYLAYRLTDRLSDVTTNVSAAAMAEAIRRGAVRADRVLLVPTPEK